MDEVNSLFRDWNDQDLLAGDLPDDYKVSMLYYLTYTKKYSSALIYAIFAS